MARYTVTPGDFSTGGTMEDFVPEDEERKRKARYTVVPTPKNEPSPFWSGFKAGGTMEWDDELAALLGSDKEEYRQRKREAQERSPGYYTGGKIAGTIASGLLPGGLATKAFGMGLRGAIAGGGAVGLGGGAVEAGGEYEPAPGEFDTGEMLRRMGVGGVVGGAIGAPGGAAAYGLGTGLRGGYRYLRDALGRDPQGPAIRRGVGALEQQGMTPEQLSGQLISESRPMVRNVDPEALEHIIRGIDAGQTPTQVSQNLAMRGHRLTPQQVGQISAGFTRGTGVPRDLMKLSEEFGVSRGQTPEAARSGLTSAMQDVAHTPSAGRSIALQNMGETMEGTVDRIRDRLTATTGTPLNFRERLAQSAQQRKTDATQAYGQAYQVHPTPPTAELQPILGRFGEEAAAIGGETGSRINQAIQIMRNIFADPALDTNLWQRFHQGRIDLDKFMSGLRASGDNNALRLIGQMRSQLNQAVYRRNPVFQAADQRFASEMSKQEARLIGREMPFRSGQKQDEILTRIAELERRNPTHAEELREHFMEGMLRRVADEAETSGGVPPRWVKPLTGGLREAQQRTLDEGLPGGRVAEGVGRVLEDEARLRKIFTDVWGNSQTQHRMAAAQDARELPGIAADIMTLNAPGLMRKVSDALASAFRRRDNEALARILTETDPRVLYLALQRMRQVQPYMRGGGYALGSSAASAPLGFSTQLTGQ